MLSFSFAFDPFDAFWPTLARCKNIHRRRLTGSISRPWITSFRDNRLEDDNYVHHTVTLPRKSGALDGTAFTNIINYLLMGGRAISGS